MHRCPYCRSAIEVGSKVVVCAECKSLYHLECWNSDEGCAVFGCQGRLTSLDGGRLSRVYSSPLLAMVYHVLNVLEINGITCSITNEYLASAVGELPPTECWPQLWVSDHDLDKAQQIVQELLTDEGSAQPGWRCPQCGEELEGQFTECWNCGVSRS